MKPAKRLWMLATTLVLVNECCYGCWKQEKIGLLQLKASFSSLNWVDNREHSADCCLWKRVECNKKTKRVIELNLNSARNWGLGEWYLNASLFLPFEELKSLKLGDNHLSGCIESEAVGLSRLRNLQVLDLSFNSFNDSFLTCLNELSSLRSLDLSYNMLTGSAPIVGLKKLTVLRLGSTTIKESILLQSLGALQSLRTLTIRNSNFESQMIAKELYNLTSLEELFVDETSLPVDFLQSIGSFSSLKVLYLRGCHLNGNLPAQGFCEMKNLEQLSLYKNELDGLLPTCLGNMSYLKVFDVSYNHFIGNIASSPLTNLTLLEYLSTSSNHFQVPVSFNSFMNHSNLKSVTTDYNELMEDPTFHNCVPKFQLKYLSLSSCPSTALNMQLPNFLYTQYDLRVLDLSHNNFGGMFPSWLLENNTGLELLSLRDNFFTGPLQLPYHPSSNLSTFHISNNNISGQIPKNICFNFPQLSFLLMANNGLSGSVPPCFGNMSSLRALDLSNNQLTGRTLEQLTSVRLVRMSNNNLDGPISPLVFNSSIEFLYIDGNNFRGHIMDISRSRSTNMVMLDISSNHFSGMLPRWICNMSNLDTIDASRNHFEGAVPAEICKIYSLSILDISDNNLTGSIPFCFNQTRTSHLHISKNQLSGPLPYAFYNNSYLVTLDLGHNNLIGPIPNWIDKLSSLRVLLLKANHFAGDLPIQLCLLEKLSILDLSQNNFSGPLPTCLSNLTFEASDEKAESFGFIVIPTPSSGLYFSSMWKATLIAARTTFSGHHPEIPINFKEEVVEFTTKRYSYAYKGDILNAMSGMDLSCNRFTGEIPSEFGNLREIRALNLSHNNITGSIPTTLSNMKQIESLDLSHNNLNGRIPPELIQLNTLEVFSVAHNDLSGKTPEIKAQFGTFDESSYEGNPLLCGPPLHNNCREFQSPSPLDPNDTNGDREDDGFMDMDVFYVSFGVSYIIVLLGIGAVLYKNPCWRHALFYSIEVWIDSCYYFILDQFHICASFK